jgi:hypothetical protein
MSRKIPKLIAKLNVVAARDALNVRLPNSRRPIRGSARVCCRRTNRSPTTRPHGDREQRTLVETPCGDLLQPVDHREHGKN